MFDLRGWANGQPSLPAVPTGGGRLLQLDSGSSHTHYPISGHILIGYDGKGANRKLGSVPGFGFGLCVFKEEGYFLGSA